MPGGFSPTTPWPPAGGTSGGPELLPEIRRELAAQIEVVLEAGLRVWHLNSHLNLHLHPRLFPVVVDLAREYGIPAVRLTREDWRTTVALAPDGPVPKIAQGLIFALLCRGAARRARAAGLIYNDHLFGLTNDGRMTEAYLTGLVPRLQTGVTEIYCHPGLYCRPGTQALGPPVPAPGGTGGAAEPPPQDHPGRGRGQGHGFPGTQPPPTRARRQG